MTQAAAGTGAGVVVEKERWARMSAASVSIAATGASGCAVDLANMQVHGVIRLAEPQTLTP